MKPTINNKRSCKATYFSDLNDEAYQHGEPGAVYDKSGKVLYGEDGKQICNYSHTLVFNCPGCGQFGSIAAKSGPKESRTWQITQGSLEDITTLSLSPSIHCIG